ncbi:uncharacterized protein LOC116004996 [Ipomoea triloba]|uniref:uncharacterized protein LOC116004996 n=1 Tax=Ipomoea triloba TaxID=35885 RepID=UPI00125E2535|nr:uncharacterized protein LOC116004996 [Ipomoea triloba]
MDSFEHHSDPPNQIDGGTTWSTEGELFEDSLNVVDEGDMEFITWNCQGAAFRSFLRAAKWLCSSHKSDILFLLETKTSGSDVDMLFATRRGSIIGLGWRLLALVDSWNFTVVYGSPSLHLRRRLWNSLTRTKININGPWLVEGDFNAVISNDETSSPGNSGAHRNNDFRNWIFEEALIDLGFEGQKFTWKRGQESGTFKGARLNRALCSIDCIDCPHDNYINTFKFQGAWVRHPNFLETVKENMNENAIVWDNKDNLATKLKDWNRHTFGNIHIRKNASL